MTQSLIALGIIHPNSHEIRIRNVSEHLKGRDHLEDLSIVGRIILKWIYKEVMLEDVFGLSGSESGPRPAHANTVMTSRVS
jgi:hypothetical protein